MARSRSRLMRVLLVIAVSWLEMIVGGAISSAAPAPASRVGAYATFYGWFDNTPPGCATAYAGCAGGVGSYRDPVTFASDRREFAVGTILYSPTWHKYLVMGDDCQECDLDWSSRGPDGGPSLRHIDVWLGGRTGRESAALNCENALTRTTASGAPVMSSFIENPPADLPVNTTPFFNATTNRCLSTTPAAVMHGELVSDLTSSCVGLAPHGSAAIVESCTHRAATHATFTGASLRLGARCLTTSGELGSIVRFVPCTGGPGQQWALNANGTFSWIQYVRCVRVNGARVVLGACTADSRDRWIFRPVTP